MRPNKPVPDTTEKTSDILYLDTRYYKEEDVIQLAKALGEVDPKTGVPETRWFTGRMMTPERTLFNLCLAEVQFHFSIPNLNERKRGRAIASIATHIYDRIESLFKTEYASTATRNEISQKVRSAQNYVERLAGSLAKTDLSKKDFERKWIDDQANSKAWEREAVDTIYTIHENIRSGEYGVPLGSEKKTMEDLTCLRLKGGFEYEKMNELANFLINTVLEEEQQIICQKVSQELNINHPPICKLEHVPQQRRRSVVFTGGQGSGKTDLMTYWGQMITGKKIGAREKKNCEEFMFLCPDYIKMAEFERAIQDPNFPIRKYDSQRMHFESSNTMHEMVQRMCKISREAGEDPARPIMVPNIVIETTELSGERYKACTGGDTSLEVHHISADPKLAFDAACKREAYTGRKVTKEAVETSSRESSQNILELSTQWHHQKVYLYERQKSKEVKGAEADDIIAPVGMIDSYMGEIIIEDLDAFLRIAERSCLGHNPESSKRQFINTLTSKGMTINVVDPKDITKVYCKIGQDRMLHIARGAPPSSALDQLKNRAISIREDSATILQSPGRIATSAYKGFIR